MKRICLFVLAIYSVPTASADVVYGVKSFGTGTIRSAPPAKLFCFRPGDASVTDIGVVKLGETSIDVDGLAYSPSQGLFAYELNAGTSRLLSINPGNAQALPVGTALAGREIRGATFDLAGRLWVVDATQSQLLQIDALTGTTVGSAVDLNLNLAQGTVDIAVNAKGDFLLVDDQTFYSVDPATGQAVEMHVDNQAGNDGFLVTHVGLAFDPLQSGTAYTFDITEDDDVWEYDVTAGFARGLEFGNVYLGFNSGRGDLASSISPIPEPGSVYLSCLLIVCALRSRRRTR